MKDESLRLSDFVLKTSDMNIYDNLCSDENLFEKKHQLFTFGLVYGLLHNLRSEKIKNMDLAKITSIKDEETLRVIDIVGFLLDDGKKDEKDIWKDILEYADGGIQKLRLIYDKNKSFTIPNLIPETQKLWTTRARELHNINFEK